MLLLCVSTIDCAPNVSTVSFRSMSCPRCYLPSSSPGERLCRSACLLTMKFNHQSALTKKGWIPFKLKCFNCCKQEFNSFNTFIFFKNSCNILLQTIRSREILTGQFSFERRLLIENKRGEACYANSTFQCILKCLWMCILEWICIVGEAFCRMVEDADMNLLKRTILQDRAPAQASTSTAVSTRRDQTETERLQKGIQIATVFKQVWYFFSKKDK